MAISEVPKIKDENFDKLNVAEDSKLILSLLNEYSEKLLKVCEQFDEGTMNSWSYLLRSILTTALIVITFNFIIFLSTQDSIKSIGNTLTSFIFSLPVSYLLFQIDKSQRQSKILKNSRRIAIRLEIIINIASQFNEQVTSNLVSRIEFDFRLTDAEEVLERYRYLSEKHRKSIRIFH